MDKYTLGPQLFPAHKEDAAFFASLILYEDSHLLLVYKPHGIPVQSDSSHDQSLLDYGKAYLIERYRKPGNAYLSLAHRLDRPVAGLVMMAKTTKAMQRLSSAFQQQQCRKFYLAVVEGRLPRGPEWQDLNHYLYKEAASNKSYICKPPSVATDPPAKRDQQHKLAARQVKLAKLKYRVMATGERCSVVAVQLQTGRHHQIRCQLAAIGHPIQGDLKYGAKQSNAQYGNGSIQLYAFALEVPLPVQLGDTQLQACPSSKTSWTKQRITATLPPLSQLPEGYAWESRRPCAEGPPQQRLKHSQSPSPTSPKDQEGQSPQATRVLQSICLPWEWELQQGSTAQEEIWQLCTGDPAILCDLEKMIL